MDQINFMDLKRQYQDIRSEVKLAFDSVCEETAFSGGRFVTEFENEFSKFTGSKHTIGVDSGTGALFLAVRALGLKPGDEVIVPSMTFIATAWGPLQNGLKVKFADCDPDTWEMDPISVREQITDRTKAIIGVHLYGMPFDFDSVKKITNGTDIKIIEDCAQAHGATYNERNIGSMGDVACFSFYPGKNLGAYGEAGAVTTDDKDIANKIFLMKNHGSTVRYHHDFIGYNMRLDGIQAAILSVKLKYINAWNERRREIAKKYLDNITNPDIKMQMESKGCRSVYHLFVIEVSNRKKFMDYMKDKGINCGIHYPIPCHLQNVVSNLGYKNGDLPNSEYHAEHCVSLPMFPELKDSEIEYVVKVCNAFKA